MDLNCSSELSSLNWIGSEFRERQARRQFVSTSSEKESFPETWMGNLDQGKCLSDPDHKRAGPRSRSHVWTVTSHVWKSCHMSWESYHISLAAIRSKKVTGRSTVFIATINTMDIHASYREPSSLGFLRRGSDWVCLSGEEQQKLISDREMPGDCR
jgi:hypothetical protein